MLWVYELKGSGQPPDVPLEGFLGVWPELPFYYLFYGKEVSGPISEWLKLHPGFRLTSRYELPYEKWQDISVPQIRLGCFSIRLAPTPATPDTGLRSKPPGSFSPPFIKGGSGDFNFPRCMVINPGVVFGSGLHPTTQGCLLAISEVFSSNQIRTAVDFGAGTGVLAIACAVAGAEFVLAVDRNPLALQTAARNARANGVEDLIGLVEADTPECIGVIPDLFIMNLEWPILSGLWPQTGSAALPPWSKARWMVLSGFMKSRLDSVKRLLRTGFQVAKVVEREGWNTLIIKN